MGGRLARRRTLEGGSSRAHVSLVSSNRAILAEDKLMGTLYFEDVEVGDSCTAGPYRVTKSEIIQFAKQYDPVPENISEEAAARSIFGG